MKTDHPLQMQIQDLWHKIDVDQKEIVFMWVPQRPTTLAVKIQMTMMMMMMMMMMILDIIEFGKRD